MPWISTTSVILFSSPPKEMNVIRYLTRGFPLLPSWSLLKPAYVRSIIITLSCGDGRPSAGGRVPGEKRGGGDAVSLQQLASARNERERTRDYCIRELDGKQLFKKEPPPNHATRRFAI
jgi:hypothetical protein